VRLLEPTIKGMNPKWDSYSFLVRNYVNFGDESLKRINNNYTRFKPKFVLTDKIPRIL
jgi:hypothetical protein